MFLNYTKEVSLYCTITIKLIRIMEFPSLYVSAGFRRFLQENLATPFSFSSPEIWIENRSNAGVYTIYNFIPSLYRMTCIKNKPRAVNIIFRKIVVWDSLEPIILNYQRNRIFYLYFFYLLHKPFLTAKKEFVLLKRNCAFAANSLQPNVIDLSNNEFW